MRTDPAHHIRVIQVNLVSAIAPEPIGDQSLSDSRSLALRLQQSIVVSKRVDPKYASAPPFGVLRSVDKGCPL